jgi:hypothetical protein
MPRGPTKAELIDQHRKAMEEIRAELNELRLENADLRRQLWQARQALQAEQERALRLPAWETELRAERPGRWRRLKCALGWHEPNPVLLTQMHRPPCKHCRRFKRGY